MARDDTSNIGEMLLEEGLITQDEIAKAVSDAGIKGSLLSTVLNGLIHVKRKELIAFLAADYQIPFIKDLRKVDSTKESAGLVPEAMARKHVLVPIAKLGNVLCVAKGTFFGKEAVQDLRRITSLKIKVLQADEEQVKAAIERVYKNPQHAIPEPKSRKVDTAAFRAAPPEVPEDAIFEGVPLFAGEETREEAQPADADTPVTILEAVSIPMNEFATASRNPFTRLITEFDEVFRAGRTMSAQRVG